jgi:xanthine dehydrogenase accessory factor
MDSVDREVLGSAMEWCSGGWSVGLATVVRTWGSAPRPVGSLIAIRDDGALKGSVSGGCIEDDLSERARRGELLLTVPQLVRYGVNTDEARRFGLPCGGTIELVIETLKDLREIAKIISDTADGLTIWRRLNFATGEVIVRKLDRPFATGFDGRYLDSVLGPQLRLVLVGAGQLSEYVARFAIPLGYRVIVCDPREEYYSTWSVPNTEFSREMPDDLLVRLQPDSRTAVVTLSHDPKLDDLALIEALKSTSFYVGAVGSRSAVATRAERLMQFEVDELEIKQLRSPVGFYIGAQTPPEIAIAVIAEMTAVLRGVPVLQSHSVRGMIDAASDSCRT